ncbi:MAG: DUF4124 domain-containing protein [Gammaproteobacteria bacterium]|nr:DUF4124 domain-containing protein [Gammaproteobacteria bacterium]
MVDPVHAELYRWTDENGRIHYSNVAPGSAAETLNIDDCATLECQERQAQQSEDALARLRELERSLDATQNREQITSQHDTPDVIKRTITIPPNSRVSLRRWPYRNPMRVHRPPY